jgi:heptosyltransferase II
LRLESKRNVLEADLAARSLARLPRNTRIWIRLPNWLGDVAMAAPLLRAIRTSRPDAEITLLCKSTFVPLVESLGLADRVRALPVRGVRYFAHFARLRATYADVWILLTNSTRGDLEARVAGCPQRFGIARSGRRRPLLTGTYTPPVGYEEGLHHQLSLWEDFLRHFGLETPLLRTPFAPELLDALPMKAREATETGRRPIGLIVGSENMPSKRWPVEHWKTLIASFPNERFFLFGTLGDAAITSQIAAHFDENRVTNLAGATSLAGFASTLTGCRLLVSNDTGGMHLANAFGVPVIALFGPTNPVRTGPVFDAYSRILQPPGCPPTGGAPLAALSPDTVVAAVRDLP